MHTCHTLKTCTGLTKHPDTSFIDPDMRQPNQTSPKHKWLATTPRSIRLATAKRRLLAAASDRKSGVNPRLPHELQDAPPTTTTTTTTITVQGGRLKLH
jgi:hypothetical protein